MNFAAFWTNAKALKMSDPANWISPDVMHRMAWCLIHFAWQGTAVAALTAALLVLCRRPSTRYVVAVCALVAMPAAPIVTFFLLANGGTAAAVGRDMAGAVAGLGRDSRSLDALPWLVEVWLLGVALFGLRSAGGFLLLEHGRRQQVTSPPARVLAMCGRLQCWLGLDRKIRYLQCDWQQAPAVIGWLRPIVLLPVAALTGFSQEQLELVIAHELAHIKRLDPLVNLFQILVENLLFYHPAVWWLNKRIRTEREICCDEIAVSTCGNPIAYARALTLMEEWRAAPILAMAANRSPLSERILFILGRRPADSRSSLLGLAGGMLLLGAALMAGNASLVFATPIPAAAVTRAAPSADGVSEKQARPQMRAGRYQATSPPVRHRMTRAHTRRKYLASTVDAGRRDELVVHADLMARLERPVPAPLPADTVRTDLRAFEATAQSTGAATGSPHSQAIAVVDVSNPLVCRPAQQLPGSRFFGPRTCLPKQQWAQLQAKGEDVGPDGRQIMEADAYDKNQIQLTCRTTPGASSSSMPASTIPICF